MKKDKAIAKAARDEAAISPHKSPGFKGYSLRELKYQKALAEVRRDFLKEKITNDLNRLRQVKLMSVFSGSGDSAKGNAAGAFMATALKAFSHADYILAALSILSTGRKIFRTFRRRKTEARN